MNMGSQLFCNEVLSTYRSSYLAEVKQACAPRFIYDSGTSVNLNDFIYKS